MFTKRRLVLLILIIISLIVTAQATKVNGTFYEWSDFEKPLKNVLAEVEENSTIIHYKVSTDGKYEFDLSPGNYLIKARYYRNNILELTGEENISIDKIDEPRQLDILLFPPTESEYEYLGDINLTKDIEIKKETTLNDYVILILILVSFVLIILYWFKKKTTANKLIATQQAALQPEVSEKHGELPEDLHDIYELIQKKGGRITQKELRKELKYSEAKVSLMLDDLADRGLIKKIKKGRANIIILQSKK